MPQVLVVGAGPVGMTLAAELVRYGVSVRILDKAAARTDKSKALVLWSRTLELFDRAGSAGAFVDAGRKVTGVSMITGAERVGHIPISGLPTPYPFALMLPQSDTERLLEAHLESLGVSVERRTELVLFVDDGKGVSATVRGTDGAEETIRADWLVGCDGAHSTVRHALGMSFEGSTLDSDWILADIHLAGASVSDSEISIFWHEDGVLVLFPISPGRYRVVADLGRSSGELRQDPTLAEVQALVDRRGPGGITASDPVWLSTFRINDRKVRDYRAGRVFLAGDAAHVHSPAGGQGMNTGMQDAFNLAWKLALAGAAGGVAPVLLDSYSAERSPVAKEVLAETGRLTALAIARSHTVQAIRNAVARVILGLPKVERALGERLSEISIGYPDGPLNGPSAHDLGGPRAGERLAPITGESPVGSGGSPRFALFGARTAATDRLLRDHAARLEDAVRAPVDGGGLWLVRPDGYVAMVAHTGAEDDISRYLDSIFPSSA